MSSTKHGILQEAVRCVSRWGFGSPPTPGACEEWDTLRGRAVSSPRQVSGVVRWSSAGHGSWHRALGEDSKRRGGATR